MQNYPLPDLPCFPPNTPIPEFIDLQAIGNHFRSILEVLSDSHFLQDAIWRDSFAMTGSFRTFYSARSIATAWKDTSAIHLPTSFTIVGKPHVVRTAGMAWIEMRFSYETRGVPAVTAHGFLSVAPDDTGLWKIWIMRTILGELKGHPSVDRLSPVRRADGEALTNGASHDAEKHTNGTHVDSTTQNGYHAAETPASDSTVDFQCVVIGGGQAGLSVGGRLKALGVSYVVMDKHEEVGDSWGKRYDSTRCECVSRSASWMTRLTRASTYCARIWYAYLMLHISAIED